MTNSTLSNENPGRIDQVFAKQREASRQDPYPSLETRLQNLAKLQTIFTEHQDAITEAVNADFGCRSHQETQSPH